MAKRKRFKPASERLRHNRTVPFRDVDAAQVDRAARVAGLTFAEWARELLLKAARRELR
jgi:hypothetical protein